MIILMFKMVLERHIISICGTDRREEPLGYRSKKEMHQGRK